MRPLFLLALLFSSYAVAERISDTKLKGLGVIGLYVLTDDASEKCGVTKDQLREAVLLPIRAYTKVREWKAGDGIGHDGTMIVNVVSVFRSGLCAHAVHIQAVAYVDAKLRYSAKSELQTVIIWDTSNVVTHRPGDGEYMRQTVESMARDFASQWQKANP